jgi:hypothetical protein
MNKFISTCFLFAVLSGSCAKSTDSDIEIYNNDFENGNLTGIINGTISTFNGTKVIGNYNAGGFDLTLNDLPVHDLVDISFDLYIHDSWEGNQQLRDNENGPDIWQLKVDGKTFINTTFSNLDCLPGNYCPPQSYPADYPNNFNNPKSDASRTDLPGFCSQVNNPNGTTLYQIHKSISHSENRLTVQFADKLVQKLLADPKCDESWSVDNIKIKAINLN